MNDENRAELDALKRKQLLLAQELQNISKQLKSLEVRLATSSTAAPEPPAAPIPALKPAGTPATPASVTAVSRVTEKASPGEPPPFLSNLDNVASASNASGGTSSPRESMPPPLPPLRPPGDAFFSPLRTRPSPRPDSSPGSARSRSLELRLGTYWAPRIGIVVLLTGLVFIGNLAYQTLGPAGRILLLYAASGVLLGAGAWWQRRTENPTLRNYAHVLFAGGLAALYFTTYAAHHVENLRVISSPVVDGALLLVCAALIVFTADRWKSEVLALFGAGLAYYTCLITRTGSFTLYSNLLLTLASVFFLVRNRWAALTFASVAASYGAWLFWRFFHAAHWDWSPAAQGGIWSGVYFLAAYWIVFSSGVFLTKNHTLTAQNRAAFVTMNNGAFFTCFLLVLVQGHQEESFWLFAIVYGGVLLVLSELASRLISEPPGLIPAPRVANSANLVRDFYLSQGLLLVTVGFISKFAGLNLALVLAAESVLLLLLGQARKSLVLLAGAYISAGLSVGWAIDGMRLHEPTGIYLGIGIGCLMIANALLVERISLHAEAEPAETAMAGTTPAERAPLLLRPDRSYFIVLALATWLVATYDNSSRVNFPLVLAGEGLLMALLAWLRMLPEAVTRRSGAGTSIASLLADLREFSLIGQAFVLIAQVAWLIAWWDVGAHLPWWSPGLLLALSLCLIHWWQFHQPGGRLLATGTSAVPLTLQITLTWQGLYSLGIVAVLCCWLGHEFEAQSWLVVASLLAVGITLYSVVTRAWLLGAAAQIFVAISIVQYARQMWASKPTATIALVPVTALLCLSMGTVQWFARKPGANPTVRDILLPVAMIYRWIAILMVIPWVMQYTGSFNHVLVFALLGVILFVIAGWRSNVETLVAGALYTAIGIGLFWNPGMERPIVYWGNAVALILLLAQQQIAKRFPKSYRLESWVHPVTVLVGGISFWRFFTVLVTEQASGFYLTATWSLLALVFFACGILLRERAYRWLGLGLLACSLGRIVVFDVWKLQTLYRILSFMALGIVLLVLGFIYSKYQEKIKEWL